MRIRFVVSAAIVAGDGATRTDMLLYWRGGLPYLAPFRAPSESVVVPSRLPV
jgi:hypothetical protein